MHRPAAGRCYNCADATATVPGQCVCIRSALPSRPTLEIRDSTCSFRPIRASASMGARQPGSHPRCGLVFVPLKRLNRFTA
jgi:hypothetical protein